MRLNTQAELIESLEADLKAAKAMSKSGEERHEIARLREETRGQGQRLEDEARGHHAAAGDVDEQQRKLAKLRGSETETLRLKAISDKDRSSIDALEREIAQLRESADASKRAQEGRRGAERTAHAELEAKLKERENSVNAAHGHRQRARSHDQEAERSGRDVEAQVSVPVGRRSRRLQGRRREISRTPRHGLAVLQRV